MHGLYYIYGLTTMICIFSMHTCISEILVITSVSRMHVTKQSDDGFCLPPASLNIATNLFIF